MSRGQRELYLDFEFARITEPRVNLVCAATFDPLKNKKKTWWLHNSPKEQSRLEDYLVNFDVIIAYSAIAECRSFLALRLDPLHFQWLDLYLEYKMMTNHNDSLQWGEQLVDGRVRNVQKPRPKWQRTEDDDKSGFKATHSLAEATFKLTGQIRDTEHKTRMRNLIISDPKKFTPEEQKAIMEYCLEDVVFLPEIRARLWEEFQKQMDYPHEEYMKEALWRGRYAAHTSIMESRGYPIDLEKTKNFSRQVGNILFDCQRDINQLFPEVKPFKWNRKLGRFSWNQTRTKRWIEENHNLNTWKRTDKGKIALSLEAFERFYNFKHNYPRDNFGAQMVRYLKLKQSIYGFVPTSEKKKKTFWDSVGSDGRVRPYMNIYGAQSGRSQPAATGFMFLKPAWMRALVQPAPGHFMAGIDYGQQEFFIAGLESGDPRMIEAYLSGDPYLYGAKLAGVIPQEGTKSSHKIERDIFKNTYLGIQFGMTKFGLSVKLSNDTGRKYSEEDAQDQIDLFEETYPEYMRWKEQIASDYANGGAIRLPCGWWMWTDNENIRSVMNVPVQGFGASVMRKAVDLAAKKGIYIAFTLHDALYMEDKIGNEWKIKVLNDCMIEAFASYFPEVLQKEARQIKTDPFAWSPDYKKDSELNIKGWIVPCSNLYIDERAQADYDLFSSYFEKRSEDDL